MGLNRSQYAVLHVAKKELALDDDTYRDVLHGVAGVRSAKELDQVTFRAVMSRFEELGFKGSNHRKVRPRTRAGRPDPNAMVTGAQMRMLQHLYAELGMTTLPRQNGFNKRVCGHAWPQTRAEASRVIEALKKMRGRGYDAGPAHT